MKKNLIICALILCGFAVKAQLNIKDSVVFAPMMSGAYIAQLPEADLVDRFGFNNNIGGSFLIKNRKNILFGVSGGFIFGDEVKDLHMFDDMKAPYGDGDYLITSEGHKVDDFELLVFERGWQFAANFGGIFNKFGHNANSGLMVLFGVGFMEHKIRFEDPLQIVPQVQGDYAKGYDRLSNGLMLTQFIGYQYFGEQRLMNFFVGLEFQQAFTQSRRSYNFDTMSQDETQRFDMLNGLKVGWTIPFYKRTPQEFYEY